MINNLKKGLKNPKYLFCRKTTKFSQKQKLVYSYKNFPYTQIKDNFVQIKYVRYGSNFLIGVRGSSYLAKKLMRTTQFFLKSCALTKYLN